MTEIFDDMVAMAPKARFAVGALAESRSPGRRLAAIAILHAFPELARTGWLADRLDPDVEKPFVGYQAAVGLVQAARSLSSSDHPALLKNIKRAKQLAERNPHDPDRIGALDYALNELTLKDKRDAR